MFVFYDPNSLKLLHVVVIAPPDYREFLSTQPDQSWVETDEDYAPEEIEIVPDHSIRRRQRMNIVAPDTVEVGQICQIAGVPVGVTILVNGEVYGTMDSEPNIEFEPKTGGTYTFRFEGSGFIAQEKTIEAVDRPSA